MQHYPAPTIVIRILLKLWSFNKIPVGCQRLKLVYYSVQYNSQDLESYIAELVPSLAALDGLDSSFSSFYVCTAARKFLFFLDPLRVGRVRIRDVLSCSFLDDLLEVRER